MKLIIAGGRNFNNSSLLVKHMKHYSSDTEIVCGMAHGADAMGLTYALLNNLKVHKFPADWNTHGKSAGYKRNLVMGEFCDEALIFWNGESKGTKHMIDIMKKLGKPHNVVRY